MVSLLDILAVILVSRLLSNMGNSLGAYPCFTSVLVPVFFASRGSRRFSVGGSLGSWRDHCFELGSCVN